MGEVLGNLTNEELCDYMCGQPEEDMDMTMEEAIDVLENMMECDRLCLADVCDHDCVHCEHLQNQTENAKALKIAVSALRIAIDNEQRTGG